MQPKYKTTFYIGSSEKGFSPRMDIALEDALEMFLPEGFGIMKTHGHYQNYPTEEGRMVVAFSSTPLNPHERIIPYLCKVLKQDAILVEEEQINQCGSIHNSQHTGLTAVVVDKKGNLI